MKRIFAGLVIGLIFAVSAYGQSNLIQTQNVRNEGSTTLKKYAVVKTDTSYKSWAWIDTGQNGGGASTQVFDVWINGNSSDTVGNYDINRHFLSDSLNLKKGGAYQVSLFSYTSATNDTVVIYGDTINNFRISERRYADCIDTVILSTTVPVYSTPYWYEFDSLRLYHHNAGADCVQISIRHPNSIIISDSMTNLFAGVVYSDSIPADSGGVIITEGVTEVYVDGGSGRVVEPGEVLYTDVNGKLSPPEQLRKEYTSKIIADTARITTTRTARYYRGLTAKRPVTVTPMRIISAADTISYGAETKTDSLIIVSLVSNLTGGTAKDKADSLSYIISTTNAFVPDPRYSVGFAIDPTRADSSRIRVRITRGAGAAY